MSQQWPRGLCHARRLLIVVWVTAGFPAAAFPQDAEAARPFAVDDGITMTRINTGTRSFDAPGNPRAFHTSPDDRSTALVVRRGDLSTGETQYELLLYATNVVRAYVNKPTRDAQLPSARVLVRFRTRSHRYGIALPVWSPDSRAVLFIGRGADQIGQVYSVDIAGRLLQLTEHAEDIEAFSQSADGRVIVFSSQAPPPDWRERNARGYALGPRDGLTSLYNVDPRRALTCCRQYVLQIESGTQKELAAPTAWAPPPVWVSPRGRWAVTRGMIDGPVPSGWRGYGFLADDVESLSEEEGAGADEQFRIVHQFFLTDLASGVTRPLLDAPIGDSSPTSLVIWSEDERRVIVASTYLPLDTTDPAEREHRQRFTAVAEVDINTGQVRRIADVDDSRQRIRGRITALQRLDDRALIIERHRGDEAAHERFELRGEAWQPVRSRDDSAHTRAAPAALVYSIRQSLNSPPEISVRDNASGRERVISDLNPQLREVTFGHVEVFSWRDRLGRVHQGGLVRPAQPHACQRCPVVIQTYGFDESAFLLEGPPLPGKGVFSAQVLANEGMYVLQMPREPTVARAGPPAEPYSVNGEMPRFLAMLEGAIEALDARGLIDPARVGLTGFSRSASQVLHAITFSDHPIAASVIADGAAITPYAYASEFAAGPFMRSSEREIGAAPWGQGLKLWMERSPAFHYDKIRTPLRLEAYGAWADARWDTYATLKRLHRPVELYHIPDGTHILTSPHAVRASQQATVDWYRYWLSGVEDPQAQKLSQYVRWRELRAQHERHMAQLQAKAERASERGVSRSQ